MTGCDWSERIWGWSLAELSRGNHDSHFMLLQKSRCEGQQPEWLMTGSRIIWLWRVMKLLSFSGLAPSTKPAYRCPVQGAKLLAAERESAQQLKEPSTSENHFRSFQSQITLGPAVSQLDQFLHSEALQGPRLLAGWLQAGPQQHLIHSSSDAWIGLTKI